MMIEKIFSRLQVRGTTAFLGWGVHLFYIYCLLLFGCTTSKNSSELFNVSNSEISSVLAPYMQPPDSLVGDYGIYRSPLKFYDGRVVRTRSEWIERRKEIFDQWQSMMGKWPSLFTAQRLVRIDSLERENFMQYTVRFEWIPGEMTNGYLLIPNNAGKKPAVVNVYYEPETGIGLGRPFRDYAYQLARRGFVTLSIGTTEATQQKTYALYYPGIDSVSVQPLSMLACAAANAWWALAKENAVDSTRIGIVGHSFGGKWAMFASCLFDKYACAVWSDPGIVFDETRESINYWEPWYLGYHSPPWRKRGMITPENPAVGLYPELRKRGYNLTELHALMAPRPFLVSGGSEDPPKRWRALNHSLAINNLLGYKHRVAMTNRPDHSPNEESNEIVYSFFEYYLK